MSIWDQLYEAYGLSAVCIVALMFALQIATLTAVTWVLLKFFLGRL